MNRARKPHDPLEGRSSWQQGVSPDHHPAPSPEPQQQPDNEPSGEDVAEAFFDHHLRQAMLIVRRQTGAIPGTSSWRPAEDRLCRRIYQKLKNGVPAHVVDPPPFHQPGPPRDFQLYSWREQFVE